MLPSAQHQWIHVDPERAAAGPYGATIAHGLPHAVADPTACRRPLHDPNRIGTDQPRQQHDSLPNAGHRRVAQAGAFLTVGFTIEVEGHDKPACVAECVTLWCRRRNRTRCRAIRPTTSANRSSPAHRPSWSSRMHIMARVPRSSGSCSRGMATPDAYRPTRPDVTCNARRSPRPRCRSYTTIGPRRRRARPRLSPRAPLLAAWGSQPSSGPRPFGASPPSSLCG